MEFWPDYGGALLWAAGERVGLDEVPLPESLRLEARRWLVDYDDSKMPWEPTVDEAWLSEGRRLFQAMRELLVQQGVELIAGEDHWRSG